MGRVSRNLLDASKHPAAIVTPRMGRVSRNYRNNTVGIYEHVTPRMGRVSRNFNKRYDFSKKTSRPAWGV